MFNISANGIIELHRGDTVNTPIYINVGTSMRPEYYDMIAAWEEIDESEKDNYVLFKEEDGQFYGYVGDTIFFGLLEPNQRWEKALVKKVFTAYDFNYDDKSIELRLDTEDTEYLEPGNYYYEIKLYRCPDPEIDNNTHVDTIVGRTKFVIME